MIFERNVQDFDSNSIFELQIMFVFVKIKVALPGSKGLMHELNKMFDGKAHAES